MRLVLTGVCALCVWASAALPAHAAWDNVFQPTLFGLFRQPTSTQTYYVPPTVAYASPVVAVQVAQASPACDSCAQPAPQPSCSTSYTQRCYYQPVTTYQTKSYYEPVTTYRTSYYYEPVTSYRISAYYDPCSCGYQQVATPTVSYQLRAQNCPVQSWVQRCVQEPVVSYQKSCYWQPQTTCCQTTIGTPVAVAPPAPPVSVAPSINPIPNEPAPPNIQGTRTPNPGSSSYKWDTTYPPPEKAPEIRATPGTSWQPKLDAPVAAPNGAPPVKLDRISVGPNSRVEGQVVSAVNTPKASAKVMFINAGTGKRETIVANEAGRFQVELPAGSWHVYVYGANDVPVHHDRIDVNGAQTRQVNLVSRSN